MKWLDAMLGRTKLPKANLDSFFTLSTAQVTLQAELGLLPTSRAGVCFKPVTSSDYRSTESTVRNILELAGKEFRSEIRYSSDSYGYTWSIFEDRQFEDLVSLVHMVSKTFDEEAFSEQLLTAVFAFQDETGENGKTVYLIYNYKRGTFYPFVPLDNQQRDNALEIRISSLMAKELPMEKDFNCWYPIWNCPV